jgi:hypothetical protein
VIASVAKTGARRDRRQLDSRKNLRGSMMGRGPEGVGFVASLCKLEKVRALLENIEAKND